MLRRRANSSLTSYRVKLAWKRRENKVGVPFDMLGNGEILIRHKCLAPNRSLSQGP